LQAITAPGCSPGWKTAVTFARCWPEAVPHIWLSFDLPETGPLVPHLYVRTDRLARESTIASLAPLLAQPWVSRLAAALHTVALQPAYVGLLQRIPALVRLILYAGQETIPTLLARLQDGGLAPGDHTLDLFPLPPESPIGLVLDISGTGCALTGLELLNGPGDGNRAQWRHTLAQLATTGLCTSAQAAALLDFSGFHPVRSPQPAPGWEPPGRLAVASRTLSHLKLAETAGGLRAQAYLSLRHGWLATGAPAPGEGRL
jgi:hypothetical protein